MIPEDDREDWSTTLYIVAGDAHARNFGSDAYTCADACGVKSIGSSVGAASMRITDRVSLFYLWYPRVVLVHCNV